MPRDYKARENQLRAKATRARALERNELRGPSEPRRAPSGVTSAHIKTGDPEMNRLVAEALARRAAL